MLSYLFLLSLLSYLTIAVPTLNSAQGEIDLLISLRHSESHVKRSTASPVEVELLKKRAAVLAAKKRGLSFPGHTTSTVELIDQFEDYPYLAPVSIGTPPQNFSLFLDTGSTPLWVASGCTDRDQCASDVVQYDPQKSSTYRYQDNSFEVDYADGGSVRGNHVSDVVRIGSISVPALTFGAASFVDHDTEAPNSGLLGMGYAKGGSSSSSVWFKNAKSKGNAAAAVFAVQLARYVNDHNAQDVEPQGGTLQVGGYDTTKAPSPAWISVNHNLLSAPTDWTIPLNGLGSQYGQVSNVPSYPALIDTGTSLIFGPAKALQSWWKTIPNGIDRNGDATDLIYPCNQTINLTLGFSGKTYRMSDADLNYGPSSHVEGYCQTTLYVQPDGQSWTIGVPFLKNVYTVFDGDNNRISFTQL